MLFLHLILSKALEAQNQICCDQVNPQITQYENLRYDRSMEEETPVIKAYPQNLPRFFPSFWIRAGELTQTFQVNPALDTLTP